MRPLGRALRRTPYDREIFRLALPALGALAADPLVSLVDTAYVGRIGTEALGALAIAAAVFAVAFTVVNFLQYGTTPLVAREIGRLNPAGAGRIVTTAAAMALVIGFALMALLIAAPQPFLRGLGAGPALMEPATVYLRIRALALPAVLIVVVGHGVFRGAQDTRTPFVIALGLNLVNLILDPVLIFGFDLGLAGAAWATVVAQWLGAAGFVWAIAAGHRGMPLELAAPSWKEVRALSTAGRNLVLRSAALLVVFTATTAVAARLGAVPVAAHQIAIQLFFFLALAMDAIAIAAQAMLGKAIGEADGPSMRLKAERLVGLGVTAGVAVALLLILVLPWLPGWFSSDPAVQEALRSVYPPLVGIQIIGGAVFAWDGIVIGATDFRSAMVATAAPSAVVMAALIAVVPLGWSLTDVWGLLVVMMGLRAALLVRWHVRRLGTGRIAPAGAR